MYRQSICRIDGREGRTGLKPLRPRTARRPQPSVPEAATGRRCGTRDPGPAQPCRGVWPGLCREGEHGVILVPLWQEEVRRPGTTPTFISSTRQLLWWKGLSLQRPGRPSAAQRRDLGPAIRVAAAAFSPVKPGTSLQGRSRATDDARKGLCHLAGAGKTCTAAGSDRKVDREE